MTREPVDTGYFYDLTADQFEVFDPLTNGWDVALPYSEIFPEAASWPMPFQRDFYTDDEGNRLIIEREEIDVINRVYLNGKRQQPHSFKQLLLVVRDKKSLY